MKKWLYTAIAITGITAATILSLPDKTLYHPNELAVLECAGLEPIVSTKLFFYVDSSIADNFDQARAQEMVDYANTVLVNSCVPMQRELGGFEYVEVNKDLRDWTSELHGPVVRAIGQEKVDKHLRNVNEFYIAVFSDDLGDFSDSTVGYVNSKYSRFVVMTDRATDNVLEHELGHHAGAEHVGAELTNLAKASFSAFSDGSESSYATAAHCANAGTIMSYKEIVLPIYSSPEASYRGEACGHTAYANNQQVLVDYAHQLAARLP